MIVRVSKTRPLLGSVKPTWSKSQKSPLASPRPRRSPTIDASTPTTRDSIMIDRRTCRRDAPTVRSVASSRVRWAIVIESEFAITKAPTKSAIPPNESRNVRRNVMKEFVSFGVLLRLVGCGADLRVLRQHGAELVGELLVRDPGLCGDGDLVELSLHVEDPLRGR